MQGSLFCLTNIIYSPMGYSGRKHTACKKKKKACTRLISVTKSKPDDVCQGCLDQDLTFKIYNEKPL